jgi:hypothetical protein
MLRSLVRTTLLAALALSLGGCASTQMQSSWSDPAWKGGLPNKIIIIGIAQQEGVRRSFEDQFRDRLAEHKVEGIPSYTLFAPGKLEEAAVMAKVEEIGVTGIIVTRTIDRKTVETYYAPTTTVVGGSPYHYPSYYGGMYPYYNTAYSVYTTPGYTETTEYVYLESNLYNATDGNIIWTGRSETAVDPGNVYRQLTDLVRVLMNELTKLKKK